MSFFITGTDTGVGKTVVTACLAALAQEKTSSVCIYKPIQTGSAHVNLPEDPEQIRVWLRQPIDCVNTYNFTVPVAPYIADTGRIIRKEAILQQYRDLRQVYEIILVEGAGGVHAPLAPGWDMLDLMSALDLPVIIVARPNLGTINHTLMTVDVLQSRRLSITGVVVSNYPKESPDPAIQTLPDMFKAVLPVPVLAYLPPLSIQPGAFFPGSSALHPLRNAKLF